MFKIESKYSYELQFFCNECRVRENNMVSDKNETHRISQCFITNSHDRHTFQQQTLPTIKERYL